MQLGLFSINYENTPLKAREKVKFTSSLYKKAYNYLENSKPIKESVILSTCNRTEVYFIYLPGGFNNSLAEINKLFLDLFKVNQGFLTQYLREKQGFDIINYLYQLVSGLKSQVFGEEQILGQIKEAHQSALEHQSSGKYLNKIFREAVTIGKEVRHQTGLSSKSLSLSSVAVKYIEDKLGNLKEKKVLVVGVGQMSRIVLDLLRERGAKNIFATNRTHGKVVDISNDYQNLCVVDYTKLAKIAGSVDIVISSTAAPHYILHYNQFIKEYHYDHQLCLIDLGVPRDIDPQISSLSGVNLYNIDQLTERVKENREFRESEINRALDIINRGLISIKKWEKHQQVVPIIKDIKRNNGLIIKEELDKFIGCSNYEDNFHQELTNFAEHLGDKLYNKVILNLKEISLNHDQELIDKIAGVLTKDLQARRGN